MNNEVVMTAVRKSKAVRAAQEAAILAELKARKDVADATGAEARKRSRLAEIETKIAWPIVVKDFFFRMGFAAFLATVLSSFKR
ncbi:hypothetical protein [Brevundimonas sp.]|uniref:hypothetical protein n=1 Tax=Brevundimonas sp. TaxID=1871086 RepID=UPI002898AC47|nr:hypothetical protein [Brevundimonas sp.]